MFACSSLIEMNGVTKEGLNSSMFFFQQSQVNNKELFLEWSCVQVMLHRRIWDFAYMIFKFVTRIFFCPVVEVIYFQ